MFREAATDTMSLSSELSAALEALRLAAEADIVLARENARRDLVGTLHNIARRLARAESQEEWVRTLGEAAGLFYRKALFLPVRHSVFLLEGNEVPLHSTPAIATAVESKDTVISAATAGELSEQVIAALGEAQRVWLVPVLVQDRVAGVLCAVPDTAAQDVSAAELFASLASAGAVLPVDPPVATKPPELIAISGAAVRPPKPAVRPEWDQLPPAEQALHLRAQRFARTAVAEILLHKTGAVQRGRASSSLYDTLKEEIDEGREAFRRQFRESCPSMVDYFHLELVRSLALGDTRTLGPGYPGPLA